MRNPSAAHDGISAVDLYQPEGPTARRPFSEQTERYSEQEPPLTGNADTSVYRIRRDDDDWNATGEELSPPSYDETTGGLGPPTHITYIIHR
jgi:hypothetical protein